MLLKKLFEYRCGEQAEKWDIEGRGDFGEGSTRLEIILVVVFEKTWTRLIIKMALLEILCVVRYFV